MVQESGQAFLPGHIRCQSQSAPGGGIEVHEIAWMLGAQAHQRWIQAQAHPLGMVQEGAGRAQRFRPLLDAEGGQGLHAQQRPETLAGPPGVEVGGRHPGGGHPSKERR